MKLTNQTTERDDDKAKAIMVMAHEIRSPLTVIKMSNQLLKDAFEKEKVDRLLLRESVEIISKNITRIENYLKELFNYNSETEGCSDNLNICECLNIALSNAKDRILLSGIQVYKNYKGSHWVNGNKEKLKTVFLNIIINAIEAIKGDKGKIWISLYELNKMIRITIKDNGVGMSPSIIDKIFDPFFSNKRGGLGIGLYNVKRILSMHNASIIADSMPNAGTTISIMFNSLDENVTNNSKQGK